MIKLHGSLVVGCLLLGAVLLPGCGKGDAQGSKAVFDGAPPEIRAAWNQAFTADKTNDYVPAVLGYRALLRDPSQLQPAQLAAIEEASGKLNQRLTTAALKGESGARQALAVLRGMDGPQGAPH